MFYKPLNSCSVVAEPEVHPLQSRYLHLHELLIDDIIWVDEADNLEKATSYIEGCKVVGVDCEWKPNYVKGGRNKVPSFLFLVSSCIPSFLQSSTLLSLMLEREVYDVG